MLVRRFGWPRSSFGLHGPLARLQHDMDRLTSALTGAEEGVPSAGVFPAMNVTQDPDSFFLRAELPGIDPKMLEISAVRNRIMISGERRLDDETSDVSYHRREREGGRFSRTLVLPTEIDAERVNASYKHGLLTITLPKAEIAKPKQIRVTTR